MTEVAKAAERYEPRCYQCRKDAGKEPCGSAPHNLCRRHLEAFALPLLDSEPITEDWLKSVGFKWQDSAAAWYFAHRRLIVAVRTNGQWWLEFDATYCGKVGTYNRMKTRGQLRLAVVSLGITLTEPSQP